MKIKIQANFIFKVQRFNAKPDFELEDKINFQRVY